MSVHPPSSSQRAARVDVAINIAIVCLLVGALAFMGRSVRVYARSKRAAPVPVPSLVADWAVIARDGDRLGDASVKEGPVRITVFSDYQCPFCAALHDTLRTLQSVRAGVVTIRLRHLPLVNIHPFALESALAAKCAGQQGHFREMSAALFAGQSEIGVRPAIAFARMAGVPDSVRFARCMAGKDSLASISADMAVSARLRLTSTPSVLINEQLIRGAPSLQTLTRIVDSLVAHQVRP